MSDGVIDQARWDGGLTVSADVNGKDTYGFGHRAAAARMEKHRLGLDPLTPLPSPWTLEFEPTLLCNARCDFCSYEDWISDFRESRKALPVAQRSFGLTLETVTDVLAACEQAGTTRGVFWSGGGDPLMWPFIVDGLRRAAAFADNSIQTNGILLHKVLRHDDAMSIMRLLSLSMFASEPELHHEIAGVDTLDVVVKNLKELVRRRDAERADTHVAVKILVTRKNYDRLIDITRFYEDLGVDSVALRQVEDRDYGNPEKRRYLALGPDEHQAVLRLAEQPGAPAPLVSFAASLATTVSGRPRKTLHCYNATDGHFACVTATGEVYTGNPEINVSGYSIGNVNATPWSGIWGSERHHEVVGHMEADYAAGRCDVMNCRHVRANIGVDELLASGRTGPIMTGDDPLEAFL